MPDYLRFIEVKKKNRNLSAQIVNGDECFARFEACFYLMEIAIAQGNKALESAWFLRVLKHYMNLHYTGSAELKEKADSMFREYGV